MSILPNARKNSERWSRATQDWQIKQLADAREADRHFVPFDAEMFDAIKESVAKLYGWTWPDGVGWKEGCLLLMQERVRYWDDRLRAGG